MDAVAENETETLGGRGAEIDTEKVHRFAIELAQELFKLLAGGSEKTSEAKGEPQTMEERVAQYRARLDTLTKRGPGSPVSLLRPEDEWAAQIAELEEAEPHGLGKQITGRKESGAGLVGQGREAGTRTAGAAEMGSAFLERQQESGTRRRGASVAGFHPRGFAGRNLWHRAESGVEATRTASHSPELGSAGKGSLGDGFEKLRQDMNRNHADVMRALTHKNFSRP